MFDPSDITPEGVSLSDPTDFKKRRMEIFEIAKNSFARKFPMSYGGFRLEVGDLRYEDPEHYSLKQQKEALLKNKYLSRRLRGTLNLYDEKTNKLLENKELTLMRVPYLTDRGTTIHNGNEYVTLTQARLLPGIYTRRRETGEIESHFNARRGTGNAFRIRLEPESQLYKMDIGQASLRLYSLLHDIGVTDDRLKRSWGADILAANKAGYDARVFEKAYSKLVKQPNPDATRSEKVEAIREALEGTKFSNKVLQRTLPNLFNSKIASVWYAKQAMMQPQQYAGVNPMVNPQLQGKPVANSPDAYVKYEEQKQKDALKEQERRQKHRLTMDLLYGKLEEEGPNRDAVEKQMLQNQIALRKAKNQAITKNITGQMKFETSEQIRKIKEETQRQLDAVKRKQKELDDHWKDLEQREKEERDEREKEKEEIRKWNLKEDSDKRKEMIKERSDKRKAEVKEKADRRKAELKIKAEKRKAEIAAKAEKLRKELEASLKKYQPSKPETEKKAGDAKSVVEVLLEAKKHSDLKQYAEKTDKVRNLIKQNREDFFIDSDENGIVGITHAPSNFQIHLPKENVFDLDIPTRNPKEAFYKESKKRNIKVLPDGQMIDVDKLYATVEDRDVVRIPIKDLKGLGNRSRRDRFGPKRYEAADPTLPGLIDNSNYVVDGRHRIAKTKDNNGTEGLFYVVTPTDIRKAYVDGGHSDFESETKINLKDFGDGLGNV